MLRMEKRLADSLKTTPEERLGVEVTAKIELDNTDPNDQVIKSKSGKE